MIIRRRWRDNVQQFAHQRQADFTHAAGEQAVVADAMEAARQHVEQEASNELAGGQRHDLPAINSVAAIILVAECDTVIVEGDQAVVRDRDPMRVA